MMLKGLMKLSQIEVKLKHAYFINLEYQLMQKHKYRKNIKELAILLIMNMAYANLNTGPLQ